MDQRVDQDFLMAEVDYSVGLLEANLQFLTLLLQTLLWSQVEQTHPTNLRCFVAYVLVPYSEGLHHPADCLHLQEESQAEVNIHAEKTALACWCWKHDSAQRI